MKCAACKTWAQSPLHFESTRHRQQAWWYCYGRDQPGYKMKASCPQADWKSREINERYWKAHDSPSTSEDSQTVSNVWTASARGAASGAAGGDDA
eukprot:3384704-Pyramimonas_sp.AAC.1